MRDLLALQADHAAQGEQAARSKLSEAEYHTRLLLEAQRNHQLSEARSELNMQELRLESADRALRESDLQIQSQRPELYQATQSSGYIRREKDWLFSDLEERERILQEARLRTLQEMEEVKKVLLYRSGKSSTVENR